MVICVSDWLCLVIFYLSIIIISPNNNNKNHTEQRVNSPLQKNKNPALAWNVENYCRSLIINY